MAIKNIKQSKYKNSGVLFELLVRQITADTLSGKPVSEAMTAMKKYFNVSTELGKEMQLYRAFFEAGKLSESRSMHFIDLIVAQRKKLNDHKLSCEKYELIKEIKNSYDLKEFLSCKIANYIVHASIYKTFLSECAAPTTEIVNVHDAVAARFTLIEHLSGRTVKKEMERETSMLKEFRQQSNDLRLLTYKLMIDKFNERYSGLNEPQKMLLREYINNVSNTNTLTKYIHAAIPPLCEQLDKASKTMKDQVTKIKLNEVTAQLQHILTKRTVSDGEVTALMLGLEISKELSV